MPKRPARRHETSHATSQTATASTPEGELKRHLKNVGLESVDAYRAWCREHGFGPAVHKSWQERREEVRFAQKQQAEVEAGAELRSHVESLGLRTTAEYEAWCGRHGFGMSLRKTLEQKRREHEAAARERALEALAGTKRHVRRPEEVIRALYAGELSADQIKTPYLRQIAYVFAAMPADSPERDALLHLLLHVQKRADLFGTDPVIPDLGPQPGNTFIEALAALAHRHASWLRPVETWIPESHNGRRQFGGLARHLLARYAVPAFMDAAWFQSDTAAVRQQQDWFIHIGIGHNIRTADIPVHLTKKAAHHFLQAPADFSVAAAFRWGQIHGLGGDEYLVRAVITTRLGEILEDEPFWNSVIHFFVNNPMLDTACLGPMLDYIFHQRFVPVETVNADGRVETGPPPSPTFSMKGRTAAALLRLVEAWHRQLAREARLPPLAWPASGIGGFTLAERDPETGQTVCWTVEELLSRRELVEEGKAMHHCVASYVRSCAKGQTSIWSVQVADARTRVRRRVMTVEVQNARRYVAQARGRCNKAPGARQSSERLNQSPRILKLWATQEGLTVPSHVLGA